MILGSGVISSAEGQLADQTNLLWAENRVIHLEGRFRKKYLFSIESPNSVPTEPLKYRESQSGLKTPMILDATPVTRIVQESPPVDCTESKFWLSPGSRQNHAARINRRQAKKPGQRHRSEARSSRELGRRSSSKVFRLKKRNT